jgi:predicted permease
VLPFSGEWQTGAFWVEGYQRAKGEPLPWGDVRVVSPAYTAAMGIPLLRGRFFTAADRLDAQRVAVVDERLVQRFALGEDPIGKRVRFPSAPGTQPAWMTVVGVVPHTKHEGLDGADRPQLYVPYTQNGVLSMSFVVRTNGDPLVIAARAQDAIKSVDRDQPITRVTSVQQLVDASLGQRRVSMTLLAGFAGLAALLAGLGLYGVMAHVVAQRRRELGVRLALGATARDIALQMLGESARLAAAGVFIGIVAAAALTRLLSSQLYAVRSGDPLTYGAVTLGLLVLMLVAVAPPVARAARVDPLVTLTGD